MPKATDTSAETSYRYQTLHHAIGQRFSVRFDYPVVFTRHALAPENPVLAQTVARREPARRHRAAVVLDTGLEAAWPDLGDRLRRYAAAWSDSLVFVGAPFRLPGGEAAKNDPAALRGLQDWLFAQKLDRHAVLLVIGGGAVLDAAGFVGALFHRGLRVVRMPTTVLAQDDSGIGVKNGVNAYGGKNALGTFAPPFAVINDFAFLDTLEPRDRLAGMAEAIKVAAIRDEPFFAWMEYNASRLRAFEAGAVERLVRRSAELHLRHIATSGDPFECGSARPLDFGHWAAHKLESLTGHTLRHGEAVAIGMALDARYSAEVGLLCRADAERLGRLLDRLGFRLWHPVLDARDAQGRRHVMAGLEEFREHLGGDLTVTMLAAIGCGIEVHHVEPDAMERALRWLAVREAAACG